MNDGERKCFQKKKKIVILASSFYKSGSIQTLRHLKCILLIIPIATSQNLGSGNTRPSRMGSVDVFPWLLVLSQDPLSGKKGQSPGLAGEETSWRKRGPFPTCLGGKLLHLRLGNLSIASWAALWNGVRQAPRLVRALASKDCVFSMCRAECRALTGIVSLDSVNSPFPQSRKLATHVGHQDKRSPSLEVMGPGCEPR